MNEIWAWGIGWIISPREKRSTGRETRHSATLFTSNPIWTGQVLIECWLGCERLVTSVVVVTRKLGLNFGRRWDYFSSPGRDHIGAHPASYPVGMGGIATEAWSSSLSACVPSRRLGSVLLKFATRLVQILFTLNMADITLNFHIVATLIPVNFTILAIKLKAK